MGLYVFRRMLWSKIMSCSAEQTLASIISQLDKKLTDFHAQFIKTCLTCFQLDFFYFSLNHA